MATIELVRSLHEFEQTLHASLEAGARLTAAATAAQKAKTDRLGYLAGHQVIAPLLEAQGHVAQAMTSTAAGHRKLSQLGATLGYKLDEGDFGDGQKDPKSVISVLVSLIADGARSEASH